MFNKNRFITEKKLTIDEINRLNVDRCERFSIIARDKLPMPGKKRRLEEILNKEILIVDFRITKSSKRENSDCLQIQFIENGEVYVLFTGSVVLIDQLQSIKSKLPIKTIIVKIDRYYSCS